MSWMWYGIIIVGFLLVSSVGITAYAIWEDMRNGKEEGRK